MTLDIETVYREHRRYVFALCLRMLRNEADADDLTQEVFMQVDRKLHTFNGESKLRTWLHRVTVNHVLMHFRTKMFKREKLTDTGDIPEVLIETSIDDKIAIDEALRSMPKGYRNVLLLREVLGLEHDEVGAALGVSAGTAKSQWSKAKAKMQRLLDKKRNPRVYQAATVA